MTTTAAGTPAARPLALVTGASSGAASSILPDSVAAAATATQTKPGSAKD